MFEIGSSLREARERQGLALADVERATRIRSKYLAALEEERFNALPEEVYAKAFLHTYADCLGLDGGLFADEFQARMEASRPPPPAPPDRHLTLPSFDRRVGAALAMGGVAILAALVAWRVAGPSPRDVRPAASARSAAETTTEAKPSNKARQRPTLADLRLTAVGDCWLSVHVGSRDGRVLYEGLLTQGDSLRFARRRLWIRAGAPWNLSAELNGRPVQALPEQTGNFLATRAGIRPTTD